MITFKDRLKELRLERSLTQKQLGTLVNTTKMAVSHWESGHSEPSISQLIFLARYFDVSVDYLIGNAEI